MFDPHHQCCNVIHSTQCLWCSQPTVSCGRDNDTGSSLWTPRGWIFGGDAFNDFTHVRQGHDIPNTIAIKTKETNGEWERWIKTTIQNNPFQNRSYLPIINHRSSGWMLRTRTSGTLITPQLCAIVSPNARLTARPGPCTCGCADQTRMVAYCGSEQHPWWQR